jgi:hypothetical protein
MHDPILARVRAAQLKRETQDPRLNVHFTREDGRPDCFSFPTLDRADAFRAKLQRIGRTILEDRRVTDFVSQTANAGGDA